VVPARDRFVRLATDHAFDYELRRAPELRDRVIKEGTVLVATADDPGPSCYFERLAIQASKNWTFAPTDSEDQRIMLVRFNLTRAGQQL